jgi:hypothetical protein
MPPLGKPAHYSAGLRCAASPVILGHVHGSAHRLYVEDIDRSLARYRDVFGMTGTYRFPRQGTPEKQ